MSEQSVLEQLKLENQKLKVQLAASKAAFLNVVGKNRDGVLIINSTGLIVYANKSSIELFGRNLGELIGESIGIPLGGEQTTEINILHRQRGSVVVEISVTDINWDDKPAYLASLRDVTERKKAEERLAHLSKHDFLTDLPNRFSMETDLKKAVARAGRSKSLIAVLYLDLDNFKKVNDSLGHDVGDELLQSVSTMLTKSIRASDTAYRLGGDEFAIILDNINKPIDAANISMKIIDYFSEPQILRNREFFINTSIGIAVYPFAGKEPYELLKNADAAMYAAKRKGKGNFQYYSVGISEEVDHQMNIDTNLHRAIEKNEFYLVYQPQIDFETGLVTGFEALLRWRHPNIGEISPSKFLSIAEDSGLIIPIGQWVLEESLKEFTQIKNFKDYTLHINISTLQLQQADLVGNIFNALKKNKVPANNFGIELTESVLMKDLEQSIKKIDELANGNIIISIDDFGTGYSSLAYLKKLSVNFLKIDQSFVKDILKDSNDTAIVKSTLSLAHELDIGVVAEGIETKQQYTFLKKHKCDVAQGYYLGKPMKLKQLKTFLSKKNKK